MNHYQFNVGFDVQLYPDSLDIMVDGHSKTIRVSLEDLVQRVPEEEREALIQELNRCFEKCWSGSAEETA